MNHALLFLNSFPYSPVNKRSHLILKKILVTPTAAQKNDRVLVDVGLAA